MIGYDPLAYLILHSNVRLAEDLPVDLRTDTYCNVLLLAIIVVCNRRDPHTKLGE